MSLPTLVLASHNAGKLAEMRVLFSDLPWQLKTQADFGLAPAEEPFNTFVENALAKARHVARHTGLPALADDAGLCIQAWGGLPGVQTAFYGQSQGYPLGDEHNVRAVLDKTAQETNRRAALVCTLVALRHEHDPEPLVAYGRVEGKLTLKPVGEGGFGFDPVLYVEALGCTLAQVSTELKNQYSHRGQAVQTMKALIQKHWSQGQ
jgi:XTP/dITP diphosphohydrolase